MSSPKLYRRRLIPDECILLDRDEILVEKEDVLITRWESIKPKKDLKRGVSAFFWKEGIKVSKYYDHEDQLMYWYCDIITHEYREEDHAYLILDLLADVLIYPDGSVHVVDLDEMADALSEGKLKTELLQKALRQLDHLLRKIYSGEFQAWQEILEAGEKL